MGDLIKAAQGMDTHRHDLGKGRHTGIDTLRKPNQPVPAYVHRILHKTIKTTGAEPGIQPVIFCHHIPVCHTCHVLCDLLRGIGDHNHPFPRRKFTFWIIHHLTDPLMDQRHGQLFPQNIVGPLPLIIPLVCIADGQMGRAHDHSPTAQINICKFHLKTSRRHKAVHCI